MIYTNEIFTQLLHFHKNFTNCEKQTYRILLAVLKKLWWFHPFKAKKKIKRRIKVLHWSLSVLPLTMASFSWPSLYFCITVSTSSMSRYPQPSLSHFSKSESIMCFLWVDSASFLACSQSQELLIRAEQKKYTIYNLFWIIELHSVHKQKLHLVWHYLVKLLHELNKRDYVYIATSICTSALALMIPEYFWASDNGKNNCLKFKMLPPCLILFNLNAKSCIYATTLFFLWFQNNSEHQIMALIFQTV